MSLERRVAALEKRSPPALPFVVFVHDGRDRYTCPASGYIGLRHYLGASAPIPDETGTITLGPAEFEALHAAMEAEQGAPAWPRMFIIVAPEGEE